MDELSPISHVSRTFIPAVFAAADDDDFIPPHHAKDLREVYAGESLFLGMEGDHNSRRPQSFLDSVGEFFQRTLHHQYDMGMGRKRRPSKDSLEPERPMAAPAPVPAAMPAIPLAEVACPPVPVPELDEEEEKKKPEEPAKQQPKQQLKPAPRSAPQQPAAAVAQAELDVSQVREQLLMLGFSASQVQAAQKRCSGLEACVEWIITNDATGGSG